VVIFPPEKDTAEGGKHEGEISEILEKPVSKADQVRDALAFDSDELEASPIAHVGEAM